MNISIPKTTKKMGWVFYNVEDAFKKTANVFLDVVQLLC